jgi:V8-like Glu-specific endopeptidase
LRRSIGALTFQTPQDEGKGTAVLISPNLILTCAHNIYDKEKRIEYKDFKFYLAVHGECDLYY